MLDTFWRVIVFGNEKTHPIWHSFPLSRYFYPGRLWLKFGRDRRQHLTYEKGIKEEVELRGDGTYQQKITDPKGPTYQHSGQWEKYTEKLGPPGVPSDGSQLQLKDYVEATDVVGKKSVVKAEKIDLITPASSFQPPRQK